MTAPRLISIKAVCEKTSLSATSVRRAWEAGDFPKPVRITQNRNAWVESAVDAWVAGKIASASSAV